MKLQSKIAVLIGALALATAPAVALAANGHANEHSNGHGPSYQPEPPNTPGPNAPLPEKAKAYGVFCKDQSRKHVAGQPGTPFSQCVTAMAKAANNEKKTARQACKALSKKHVKGEKGTAFSRCVKGVAQMRKEQSSSS
jgi:hypothetical protein